MTAGAKKKLRAVAEELAALHAKAGKLNPEHVVAWAAAHKNSALHERFEWDNTIAGRAYRLWQARMVITEVEVIYPDGERRQVYVSPLGERGREGGYSTLVSVLSDAERRKAFLAQALDEYERLGAKYADLKELAAVRARVAAARKRSA